MALQKQNYFLSITDGLDTKTDEKNVIPTKFLELENLVFTKTGSVSKRLGYQAFTKSILGGSDLETGSALTNFDAELLAYSENQLYTYSEAETKWIDKGDVNIGVPITEAIASTGELLTMPYYENIDNFSLFAYRAVGQTISGVRYKLLDRQTGTTISTGLIANGSKPRVCALQNKFIISYIESGDLKYVALEVANPSTISSPVTLLASVVQYDARLVGARVYFFGCAATGSSAIFLNSDLTTSSSISIETLLTQTQPDISVSGLNDVRLSYINNDADLKTIIYIYDLTVSSGAATITNGHPFTVSVVNKGSYGQFYVTNQYDAAPASQNEVKTFTVDTAGTVGTITTVMSQVMAQSRAIELNGRDYFVVCKDESELTQRTVRTYFLINNDGRIISKFEEENAVVLSKVDASPEYLTNLVLEDETLGFAGAALAEIQSETQTAAGRLTTPTTVRKYSTNFTAISNYFDTKLGGNLHITGGILKAYDGAQVVEHGFLEIPRAPELVSVTSNGPTPGLGLPSAGTSYQYVIVYAWRDNQGQLHRSAPSAALTVSIPIAAPNYSQVDLKLPTLTLTSKTDVEIELYRTEADGTNFYKVLAGGAGAYSTRIFNDISVPYVTFADDYPDNLENEILYTTGGVLENVAAVASKYAVTYKNRVFLLSSDGKVLYYSKIREANGPVEFNDSLFIQLDDFGGIATSMAVMDDHIIIFKEKALFALTGEGPNNLGQQDDFRLPYLISSDAGCIEANSVVRTPTSIMFKSDKGIYEVQRGFNVVYIGAPVELYNNLTISSATLLETVNEIRFTTTAGRTLVYDYYHQRWTTFTNMQAADSTSYNNQYVYLRSDGTVLAETPNYYLDNGSYIKSKLVSAWISLGGIQGFERFYELEVLGNYKAAHKLRASFAYDFVDSYLHDKIISASTVLNPSYYGNLNYGVESPYGGDGLLYQFRLFPKVQKCQSFKICLEDFQDGSNGGEGYTLSNLAATVGIKTGLNKKPASRSFGVS